jgi:RHS repeat-associated protein
MAVYRIAKDSLFFTELSMYGEKRLGLIKENKFLMKKPAGKNVSFGVINFTNFSLGKQNGKQTVYTLGKKHYEITDWLGNVRVTYTDKKSWQQNKFALNVSSSLDYYPFGSVMEGRGKDSVNYRYGFNDKEKVNEIYGAGNAYDFGARLYDGRVGRWMSVDVKNKVSPNWSLYRMSFDNPLKYFDPDGNFEIPIHKEITKEAAKFTKLTNNQIKFLIMGVQNADILGFAEDWHFDGRKNFAEIQETWNKLNASIKSRAGDYYGLEADLHTVQDFYSHSNYIELYIQYYKDQGGDMSKFSAELIPLYEEGVKDEKFREYLEKNLRSGNFELLNNEKMSWTNKENLGKDSHYEMNKDSNESKHGGEKVNGTDLTYHEIAKNVSIRATIKILKEHEKNN